MKLVDSVVFPFALQRPSIPSVVMPLQKECQLDFVSQSGKSEAALGLVSFIPSVVIS